MNYITLQYNTTRCSTWIHLQSTSSFVTSSCERRPWTVTLHLTVAPSSVARATKAFVHRWIRWVISRRPLGPDRRTLVAVEKSVETSPRLSTVMATVGGG